MNASEKIAAVPGTYEPDSEEEGNTVTVPSSATRQRTEKRFEIGLFLRRRFRRRIIRKHEASIGAGSLAPSEKKESEPSQPPATFAMAHRGGGGGPQGDGGPDNPESAEVLIGDETGPITGTSSYEAGGFVGVTNETTTEDDDA